MRDRLIVISVLGPDRSGLLADLTSAIEHLVVFQEEPKMTHVAGENVALLVTIRTAATVDEVRGALWPLALDEETHIDVHEVQDHTPMWDTGDNPYVLSVHTTGRHGVLAAFSRIVARHGGSVVDFGTRLGGGRISVLRVELAQDDQESLDALEHDLWLAGEQMGVGIKFYSANAGLFAPLP